MAYWFDLTKGVGFAWCLDCCGGITFLTIVSFLSGFVTRFNVFLRWDTNQHPLTDVDVVDQTAPALKPFIQLPPSTSSSAKPRLADRKPNLNLDIRK